MELTETTFAELANRKPVARVILRHNAANPPEDGTPLADVDETAFGFICVTDSGDTDGATSTDDPEEEPMLAVHLRARMTNAVQAISMGASLVDYLAKVGVLGYAITEATRRYREVDDEEGLERLHRQVTDASIQHMMGDIVGALGTLLDEDDDEAVAVEPCGDPTCIACNPNPEGVN